jgi:tetratricopeptide (TPR) repeat protein
MRKLFILPALLALAACSASPEEQADAARAAFAANDFGKARILATSALEAMPGNKELLLIQARSLLALGDGGGAEAVLKKLAAAGGVPEQAELTAEAALLRNVPQLALELLNGKTSSEAERLRGLAAIQTGDLAAATDHFERAAAAGDNARAYVDLARLRLMERDVARAEDLAKKAASLDANGIDTLLIHGQIALFKGDLKTALDSYSAAATRYPASLGALNGQAAALGDLGRFKDMQAVAQKAAEVAPQNLEVAYLRARAGIALKDWEAVRAVVQPLESDLPVVHSLRPLYGEALLRLGRAELAAAQLLPIVRAQPGNRQIALLLAEARLAGNDPRGAMAALEAIVNNSQARPEELRLMAKAAKAAADPRAADYERRSRNPAPQVLGADLAEADTAILRGNWAKAAIAYDRILAATDGRNVLVLNNMAYAQSMLGEHAKAREFADRALKLAPNNASVLDTAGWVRFRSGRDLEEAKRLLRQAAEQAPQNKTIQLHLAEATRAG